MRAPRAHRAAAALLTAAGLIAIFAHPARGEEAPPAPPAGGTESQPAPAPPPGGTAETPAAAVPVTPAPLPPSGFALDVLGGGQVVVDDEDSAMFRKYQDVEEPLVLPRIFLRVRSWDTEYLLDVVDVAEDDAIYRFSAQHPGLFAASIGWDEIPHHLSDETSTLYTASEGDRLLISDKIQQTLQAQPFRLEQFLHTHAHPVEIETSRKTARARASFSPYPGLTLSFLEEKEKKEGNLSRSVSTNFANGADVDEFPDPLDYETHRAEVGLEYRIGPAWVSASAGVIDFTNGVDRLLVDNPLRIQDSLGVSFGNRSAKTFLLSAPPDSEAHDVSAQAGVALPLGMRITGTFASGHVHAQADMLDFTSNSAAKLSPFYPSLPASTIDAEVDTTSYDFAFTGAPLKWLSFRAFARGYEYDNLTPVTTVHGYIVADTQITTLRRRALPYGWSRDGQGIDLRLRPLRNLSIGAGYQHESVERTFREVGSSDEDIIRLNVDYTIHERVSLHGDAMRSERTADDYDPKAYLQTFPRGVPSAQSRLLKLKRFDVASRDRGEYGVSGVFDLGHGWGFDAESRQRSDDYVDSDYGLVDEAWRSQRYGLTMKFNEPCEIRGENANEFTTRRVNARYRPVVAGQAIDFHANDWSDEISDKIHLVSGGLVCRDHDSDRWDFNANIDYSKDRQTDDAAFTSHSVFDPSRLSHARDHPPIERTLHRYSGNVRFTMTRRTNLLIGAYYEKFVENDPTQDLMIPTMGFADPAAFESAYLGVHWESYSVRVFSLLVNAHW